MGKGVHQKKVSSIFKYVHSQRPMFFKFSWWWGKRKICGKGMVWLYDFNHFISSVSLLFGKHCNVLGIQYWRNTQFFSLILSFLVGQSLHICRSVEWRQWIQRQQESLLHLFKGTAFYSHNIENGDVDIENRLVDTLGEGEGGTNWENSMDTYTLSYINR